jgi:LPXTG-motif cell wall-anchored protein
MNGRVMARRIKEGKLMRQITARTGAICAAVLLASTLTAAQELNTDKTTFVTFSAPVALPGITLPAGDYMFRLLNSQVNRNIVQIYDHDRTKLFTTVMAMPAQRNEVTGDTVITFREAPANSAPAVRYWYFPGDKFGQEFAYPKPQAMQIANANHTAVLAVEAAEGDPTGVKGGEMTHVEPTTGAGQTAQAEQAPRDSSTAAAASSTAPAAEQAQPSREQPMAASNSSTASSSSAPSSTANSSTANSSTASSSTANRSTANSSTASSSTASNSTAAPAPAQSSADGTSGRTERPAATAAAQAGTRNAEATPSAGRELPKTGSQVPLVGLAGLLALGAALGVRAVRRSTV